MSPTPRPTAKNLAPLRWPALARRRWPRAGWLDGDGRFALLAPCNVLTITLWNTLADAEKAKARIDDTGCGGVCSRWPHHIVELPASPGTRSAVTGREDGTRS